MKEQLIAVALRLQVAVKVATHDEVTTVELRRDCSEARINAAIANKRADEAAEIIQALKIEISSLKRKVRELQSQDEELSDVNSAGLHSAASVEVDKMAFNVQNRVKIAPGTGGHPERATPFQQWKMQNFVWTADTPAASAIHDKHAVDMLADAITSDTLNGLSRFQFPNKSSVAKLRRRISADDDIEVIPKAVAKQNDLTERLFLPMMRNVDTLCPSKPEKGLAAFDTSMSSYRKPASITKKKSKDKKNTTLNKLVDDFDDDDLYLNNSDTKEMINAAYTWSQSQKQQQGNVASPSRPTSGMKPLSNKSSRQSSNEAIVV